MRLPDELVHLGVRGEMDDDVDLGVLDPVDPAREGCVVAGQVLQERRERVRLPRIRPLVDTEDVVPVRDQAEGEIRADLPGRSCDENPHRSQCAYCCRSAGKRITSRIDSLPVKSMARRSMPSPIPPVGGIPYESAST